MSRSSTQWAACAAVVAALTAGACQRAPEAPSPSAAGPAGTAVLSVLSDIEGVNPLIARATSVNRDLERRMLFLPLAEEQADFFTGPPTFLPALAESWTLSEDGLDLTFSLRRDAVWSDGEPITAQDVRWTWQAMIDPEVAWAYASTKEAIQDVEVVDPHTVRFRFSEAVADPLAKANEGVILPRHAWSERPFAEWRSDAGWFFEHLVTSGPFTLEEWRPNEELVLRRNPRYLVPDQPRLERVVVRVIPDKTAQVQQLLGGDLDYVQQVPRDELERLERAPGVAIDDFWSRQYSYLCWNTLHPPFDDPEIRRALTMAIDRQQVIDTLYRGFARISISPVLSTVWAFNRQIAPWPYDPRAARLILGKSGFEDADGDGVLERDGEPLSFELMANSGNRSLMDAGTMIQEQLRQVGIEVRLRTLEFSSYVDRLKGHQFEAALGSWNIDTSLDLGYAFHSREIEDGYNFGSYASPEVDRLIDEANAAADLEQKRQLLHQLQELLHAEQPYTFLWEPKMINARSTRLRGTRPNAISSFDNLEEWWVEP